MSMVESVKEHRHGGESAPLFGTFALKGNLATLLCANACGDVQEQQTPRRDPRGSAHTNTRTVDRMAHRAD